jgi:hypothetical protein
MGPAIAGGMARRRRMEATQGLLMAKGSGHPIRIKILNRIWLIDATDRSATSRCPHKSPLSVVVLEKPFSGKTFVVVDMSPAFGCGHVSMRLVRGFLGGDWPSTLMMVHTRADARAHAVEAERRSLLPWPAPGASNSPDAGASIAGWPDTGPRTAWRADAVLAQVKPAMLDDIDNIIDSRLEPGKSDRSAP